MPDSPEPEYPSVYKQDVVTHGNISKARSAVSATRRALLNVFLTVHHGLTIY